MFEVDYRDRLGKRHRPLYSTEAEALAEAAKRREELEKTVLIDDPDLTLEQYAQRWLQMGTQELEAKTRGSYAQLLKTHVLPTLGALRLRDLEWRHVKTLLRAKRAERLPRKSGNLLLAPIKAGHSKNTVRLIKAATMASHRR